MNKFRECLSVLAGGWPCEDCDACIAAQIEDERDAFGDLASFDDGEEITPRDIEESLR